MKRAIIFYNGDLSDVSRAKKYIKHDDFIICADGGAQHAVNLKIIPQVIIGDFDSLSKTVQQKLNKYPIEWVKFKTEKDETDVQFLFGSACRRTGFESAGLVEARW